MLSETEKLKRTIEKYCLKGFFLLKRQSLRVKGKVFGFEKMGLIKKMQIQDALAQYFLHLNLNCFLILQLTMLQPSETNIHRQQLNFESQLPSSLYKPVNAYTHKPALEQILAILLFATIVSMHAVFITSATATLQSPILWVLVGVTYGFLAAIAYDYIYITCKDPVDDLLLNVPKKYKENQLMNCQFCKMKVHVKSYHCQTCNRCASQFDHHCKYLNNCIGGKNYSQFIRLLMNVTFFCVSIICSGVWVFVAAQLDDSYKSSIVSQWGTLATFALTLVAMAAVDSLLFFHCYLVFFLKMTTLQYIRKGWQEQQRLQRERGQQRPNQ